MINEIAVGLYKIHSDAVIPFKGTELSACYDICACFHTETVKTKGRNVGTPVENFGTPNPYVQIFPGEIMLIPTGLIFILPPTHHIKFYPRSGTVWKRNLTVSNSPAVIDSDYTLESYVLFGNKSEDPLVIRHGEAIAQAEIIENTRMVFGLIEDKNVLKSYTDAIRASSSRAGGLGSTDGVGGVMNEE